MRTIRSLSVLTPWRGVARVFVEWSVILSTIALSLTLNHFLSYFIAFFIVATRQHALAVLMHDASHFRLVNNHKLNDLLSNWLLAFPLGVSTRVYRERHLRHHRYLNTEKDPDFTDMNRDPNWDWPKSKREARWLFAKDLLGLTVPDTLKIVGKWSPVHQRGELVQFVAFNLVLVTSLWVSGLFTVYLLLWLWPSLTVLSAIFRLRAIAEHLCTNQTRTVTPRWWERLVIAPANVGYHIEHHLFPSVPYYNLPKVREWVALHDQSIDVTHGYNGALRELVR